MVKVSTDTVVLDGVLVGQHRTVQVRLHWNRETQIMRTYIVVVFFLFSLSLSLPHSPLPHTHIHCLNMSSF